MLSKVKILWISRDAKLSFYLKTKQKNGQT